MRIYLLLCLLFIGTNSIAQPGFFNRKYCTTNTIASAVENTQGYMCVSTKNKGNSEPLQLIQFDYNGDTIYTKTTGAYKKKYVPVNLFKGGAYGGYVVIGTVYDSLVASTYYINGDIFVAQFNASGDIQHIDMFGSPDTNEVLGQSIIDGDKLILLSTQHDGWETVVFTELMLSSSKYVITKQKIYDYKHTGNANRVITTRFEGAINSLLKTTNGYIFTYNAPTAFETRAYAARVDNLGNMLWNKKFTKADTVQWQPDGLCETAQSIVDIGNNKFIMLQSSWTVPGTGYNPQPFHLVCINGATGDTLWIKSYGKKPAYGRLFNSYGQVIKNADGTYSAVGVSGFTGTSMRFNSFGDTINMKHYDNSTNLFDSFKGIIPSKYGGYLMHGSFSDSVNKNIGWLIYTDAQLNQITSTVPLSACCKFNADVQVSYNPVKQTICVGDSVVLTAYPAGSGYTWSNGQTTQSIVVKTTGTYKAIVAKNSCAITSYPVTIYTDTLLKPTITTSGGVLISNYTTGNQWYKDSVLIVGATNQTYDTHGDGGTYAVSVENVCGNVISEAITVVGIVELGNLERLKIYPNPVSSGQLSIISDQVLTGIEIYNVLGEVLLSRRPGTEPAETLVTELVEVKGVSLANVASTSSATYVIDVSALPKGLYILHLKDSKGYVANRKVIIDN